MCILKENNFMRFQVNFFKYSEYVLEIFTKQLNNFIIWMLKNVVLLNVHKMLNIYIDSEI